MKPPRKAAEGLTSYDEKPQKYFTNFTVRDLRWWGPGYGYGNLADTDVLAFIDNHDDQRDGTPVVTYKNGDQYAMSVGFMLGWGYGFPRVMSSYYFSYSDQGPPSYGQSSGFAVFIFS